MQNHLAYFTAGEFAKLHHLNKRTLHHYDTIGLFSPKHKGANGYRYYTYEQSMALENILALRELGMSLDAIKAYTQNPNPTDFLEIADSKITEIEETLKKLKQLKAIFQEKKEMLHCCNQIKDGQIEVVDLSEEYLLLTPLSFNLETEASLVQNTPPIMEHLRASWELCTYKQSCGSYISLEKVKNAVFVDYDGIFTVVDQKKKNLYLKPSGRYIRGFSIGDWDKLPALYEKILLFATQNQLTLTGYAFERGLNEFAISDLADYVTQIEILCEPTA